MIASPANIHPTSQDKTTWLPPLVCLGIPRWEGSNYLSSTVQLMAELARHEQVMYVDYPYTYKDMWAAFQQKDKGVPLAELRGQASRLQQRTLPNGAEVQLLRLPPFLPANFLSSPRLYDRVMHWNARRARKAILEALNQLQWEKPIVINAFNPALGNMLAGQLQEAGLVYYCYDEISAAPWMARHGARHEEAFLATADLTIVSSQGLYDHKVKAAKRCALVKNGVNLDLFKTDGNRPADLPTTTIIGYVGSVDDRLDYDLLQAVAIAFPKLALVFVGRIMSKDAAKKLGTLANVHLLGPRPAAQLGNYLSAFKVGLIPFVKNDLTAGIYPLKINEYLALGVPVISTNFASLSDFEEQTAIAKNTSEFINRLGLILKTKNTTEAINARKAFAAQNSWSGRAAKIRELLQEL
jgi:glycosyltransferase involved in cell wall biosynthesis